MQPPDTGNALIPWTLEAMAILHLPYLTAAKQFPYLTNITPPLVFGRPFWHIHDSLAARSTKSIWPCHHLPELDKEMVRERTPKADTVFQLFSHLVQDQEANMVLVACAEE